MCLNYVDFLRIRQVDSVFCKIVYYWLMANFCLMSDMQNVYFQVFKKVKMEQG